MIHISGVAAEFVYYLSTYYLDIWTVVLQTACGL